MGDIGSYEQLELVYMDNDDIENLLPWSLIMANRYNYEPAYRNVYTAIQGINLYYSGQNDDVDPLKIIDTATRKIALQYLRRIAKDSDEEAQDILNKYTTDGKHIHQ